MKCISLWQPWAVLWLCGFKVNETRSWPTSHRGDIAVHAAKKRPTEIPGLLEMFRADWDAWSRCLGACGCPVDHDDRLIGLGGLDYGAVIGVVQISGCERITTANAPTGDERAFGDYTPHRFMWRTNHRWALPKAIPFRGSQGIFEIPDDLLFGATR